MLIEYLVIDSYSIPCFVVETKTAEGNECNKKKKKIPRKRNTRRQFVWLLKERS